MNFRSPILVLAPHADDEVLGAFSFLSSDSIVIYFGIEDRPNISRALREREVSTVSKHLGFRYEALSFPVNGYETRDLLPAIEETIARHNPGLVLLPARSYNQDHRAVHDAAITALRPHDQLPFVPAVLVYEQPHVVVWPTEDFKPNYFRPIQVEAKLDAYRLHASQVRAHRSPETLRAVAAVRGAQVGVPTAEAFSVLRYLDEAWAETTDA